MLSSLSHQLRFGHHLHVLLIASVEPLCISCTFSSFKSHQFRVCASFARPPSSHISYVFLYNHLHVLQFSKSHQSRPCASSILFAHSPPSSRISCVFLHHLHVLLLVASVSSLCTIVRPPPCRISCVFGHHLHVLLIASFESLCISCTFSFKSHQLRFCASFASSF